MSIAVSRIVVPIALGLGVIAGCESPNTNPWTSEEATTAVAVAEAFLEALSRADTFALRFHGTPTTRLVALSDDPVGEPRVTGINAFVNQVQENAGRFNERMWSPQVHVDGRLAHIWTDYDFHRDGEFSHCGIDSFQLVRMASQWKVLSIVYTVHPDGCGESPLGPVD